MKMKVVLTLAVLALITFLIYLSTIDRKIYFLALGDSLSSGKTPYGVMDYGYNDYIKDFLQERKILEKYVNEFTGEEMRTVDLIRTIDDNQKVAVNSKKQAIKNALIKADVVTLSIGYYDFFYKIDTSIPDKEEIYRHVDDVMTDLDSLLEKIRYYCKEDVFLLGFYTTDKQSGNEQLLDFVEYANEQAAKKAEKHKVKFIDLQQYLPKTEEIFSNPNSHYPSKKGYERIATEIIREMNLQLLE